MKRRIFQTIVALLAIVGSATAQTLSVASVEATTGGQAELVVSGSGMSGVTALQFNLALPQGITLNESAITKGDAVSGHTLSVQTMDSGDRLIVLYHTDLGLVGNGTLLRLPVTIGQQAGNFSGSLYTVRTANTEAESHNCSAVDFSIKVTAADPVTVTATSYEVFYGDALPEFAFTSEGATLSGTPAISCEATASSPVGTYPIVISKGSVSNINDSYVNGTLTIKKAPLTIKADNLTKKQGQPLPTFTATYTGFKNGETEDVLTTKPTFNCEATATSALGTYDITVSGAEAQNYEISYEKGTLTVELLKGDVTGEGDVTADDVTALVYYILGLGELANEAAADVNDDKVVDIADVAALIKLIK